MNTRTEHPGTKTRNYTRPLHTGDIWGWPSRVVWFLASLSVALQAATGFLIWWNRKRAASRA